MVEDQIKVVIFEVILLQCDIRLCWCGVTQCVIADERIPVMSGGFEESAIADIQLLKCEGVCPSDGALVISKDLLCGYDQTCVVIWLFCLVPQEIVSLSVNRRCGYAVSADKVGICCVSLSMQCGVQIFVFKS